VPAPGTLTAEDEAALAVVEAGFASVGTHIEAARLKAALTEAMRLASTANQYVSEQAPWTTIKTDRERAGTVLYVALRLVDNLKVMLTPFLPFTSQRLHELLGYDGYLAGPLEFREHAEEGASHLVLTGDYASWVGSWSPSELTPGQQLLEPKPLFRKLDPEAVVAEELRRMEDAARGQEPEEPEEPADDESGDGDA
jgi:methionyl-tRNA synthetase